MVSPVPTHLLVACLPLLLPNKASVPRPCGLLHRKILSQLSCFSRIGSTFLHTLRQINQRPSIPNLDTPRTAHYDPSILMPSSGTSSRASCRTKSSPRRPAPGLLSPRQIRSPSHDQDTEDRLDELLPCPGEPAPSPGDAGPARGLMVEWRCGVLGWISTMPLSGERGCCVAIPSSGRVHVSGVEPYLPKNVNPTRQRMG